MQELNIYELHGAKQSAKGSPAATPSRRFRQVGGNLTVDPDYGEENYSDGRKYGDRTDWINSVLGGGTPALEASAEEIAWWLWMYEGAEVVVAGVNEVQTINLGAPTGGTWQATFHGRQTTAIDYNATAATVQARLEALSTIGTGNVAVTGNAGGPYTVTFQGALARRPVGAITVQSALTGGTGVTVTETTPGALAKHTFTPSLGRGFYGTFWKKQGATDILRQKFNDCLVTRLQMEASTGNKAFRVTPTVRSLDPAEIYNTDPNVSMPTEPVLIFTEAAGAWKVDGIVIRGTSQASLVLDEDLEESMGDDVVPVDMVSGTPVVTIGSTIKPDADGLAKYARDLYGTATPAAGAKPLKRVPALGSWEFDMVKTDEFGNQIGRVNPKIPGVRWTVPEWPEINPDGGDAELSLAGGMRPLAGQQPYTIDVYCQAPAFSS